METYEYSRTLEKLYCEKLKNGFKVYVIPTTNKNNYYAVLGVKYGSNDIEYTNNEQQSVKNNLGVAHFLEHLAFNMEDGEEPFTFFNKSGVNANASTSFFSTKYYIWGVEAFKKNLDYLLTFVLSPYFTDESIKRETGIINEEIRMYEDDANWCIDDASRKMIFAQLPCREKIAGSYESIKKITKEELYDCYNNFYVPNNMFLVVSGNINVEDVMDVVNNHQILNQLKPNYDIKRKLHKEPDEVVSEYKEIKRNVYIPKLKYMFKFNRNIFSMKENVKLNMYLNMMISMIFGPTSEFYEKTRIENIATAYYVDCSLYKNHYLIEFVAESDKADIFKDMVDECLNNINITEDDFRRIKRAWIASEIKMSDNNDMLAENVCDDIITYNQIYPDRIDIIETLTLKDLKKVIKEINFDNNSFILLNPKENN